MGQTYQGLGAKLSWLFYQPIVGKLYSVEKHCIFGSRLLDQDTISYRQRVTWDQHCPKLEFCASYNPFALETPALLLHLLMNIEIYIWLIYVFNSS